MSTRDRATVQMVKNHPGITRAELANRLDVSERTVYAIIRECNQALGPIATIAFQRAGEQGSGYYLNVKDAIALDCWIQSASQLESMPQTSEERVRYLLNDLLSRTGWIKLDDLSDMLFVSRATLSNDMRSVEEELHRFNLTLERRPRYGIRVNGSEMSRRLCLANIAVAHIAADHEGMQDAGEDDVQVLSTFASLSGESKQASLLDMVSRCVEDTLKDKDFHINSLVYRNLLIHISIALLRMQEGCYVPVPAQELDRLRGTQEFAVAQKLARRIEEETDIALPEEEVAYISIHLAGKQVFSAGSSDGDGLVISDEIWDLVSQMLDLVWSSFRFDFRTDLELRMNLARHIVPLGVRLTHHLAMDNPILADTKARFPLAYAMAVEASSVLSEHYGSVLSEAEIGYIALAFALAIERQKTERPKKNIVIVCASGRGTARLLEYRYREEFGAYLDTVRACDVSQLDAIDFSRVDYVFTTVPLNRTLPVPVREVGVFLDEGEIADVRELIRSERTAAFSELATYLDMRLFLPHLSCSSKEEVLMTLCQAAIRVKGVDSSLIDLVLERERLAPTAFGNEVALPHPVSSVSDETFLVVGLLDDPVAWNEQMVRAIFLISPSRDDRSGLEALYDRLTDVLMSSSAISTLLADQRLETLEKLMSGTFQASERTDR